MLYVRTSRKYTKIPPRAEVLSVIQDKKLRVSHQPMFRSQDGEHWLLVCLQQLSNQFLTVRINSEIGSEGEAVKQTNLYSL